MRRVWVIGCAALWLLSACAAGQYGDVAAPELIAEEPMVEVEAAPARKTEACKGPGDGIGGTGCAID